MRLGAKGVLDVREYRSVVPELLSGRRVGSEVYKFVNKPELSVPTT